LSTARAKVRSTRGDRGGLGIPPFANAILDVATRPRRVRGVITPLGAGAISDGKSWDLTFRLNPWREEGGPLILQDLRVLIPMAETAASRAMNRWDKGDVVSLLVPRIEEPSKGQPLWHAHARLPIRRVRADAELAAVIRERERPRTVDHPVLGRLTLDRTFDWYEGTRKGRGGKYQLFVETTEPDDDKKVARAMARAAAIVLELERGMAGVREAIADQLLDVYNDEWREGGKPLSRAAFKKRPALTSVVVSPARITLYFDDDGLFLRHTIEVRGSSRGRISEVCLAG